MDTKINPKVSAEVAGHSQTVESNSLHIEESDSLCIEDEKRVIRKIDLHLLPLLIITYGLEYLDKTTLSYSAIMGLREDLHLDGKQYSWASSMFYVGYLAAAYPICLGLVKFPLGKYLSILTFYGLGRHSHTASGGIQLCEPDGPAMLPGSVRKWYWAWLFADYGNVVHAEGAFFQAFYMFATLIIKGFGYDKSETILLSLPTAGFMLVTVTLCAILTAVFRKSRLIFLICVYILAFCGVLMIKLLPEEQKLSRLAGFWLAMCTAPTFPLMLSLFASNTAGFTKKSTTVSLIIAGFCVGSLIGPQLFVENEAPRYGVGCVLSLCLL
ncbi:Major Facilitator Superfamily [Aspergillus sclerotialis]|uniref:Major Facilitator Superfamily n=1 Tax=Aspergillus sclerotialis TaxID=2070753 RepID=A0A3A2ZSL4_9EURO|nr:Major Facilitator Superfamily [Aspergillus sclerotialis]